MGSSGSASGLPQLGGGSKGGPMTNNQYQISKNSAIGGNRSKPGAPSLQ